MVNEVVQVDETKFEPAEEYVISDLETLKVLADPLRLNILEYLSKPGTVKQIARKINKPPTKLYYHFNLLEKHELIQMVDTRIVSGIIEKHYQASARFYRVERGLLSPGSDYFDEGLDLTLSSLFADATNDIRESIRAGVVDTSADAPNHRRLFIGKGLLMLTSEEAIEFNDRLEALLKEYDRGDDRPGTSAYKVLFMLHPSRHGQEDGDDA